METTRRSEGMPEMVPSGWLTFAGLILLTVGAFNFIQGLAALFRPDYWLVTEGRLLVLDATSWGWILMLIGAVQVGTGFGVFGGKGWARGLGIAFAILNAIAQLTLIGLFPFWSLTVIAFDVMIIYALTTPMKRVY